MSQTSSDAGSAGKRHATVAFALSCLLIASFLWRALTPAHEYPLRTEQMLEIGLDILCVVGLIGVRKSIPAGLFWAALAAGIGLFLIRLHGDASWWTGHWSFSIPPR